MKRKTKVIIAVILIVILVFGILYLLSDKGCDCQKTKTTIDGIGTITETKESKEGTVPAIKFYINGKDVYTFDNETLSTMSLYEYTIKTSINEKEDNSKWLGIKFSELLKKYNEDFKGKVFASSNNSNVIKTYDSVDNLYILFKKNDEFILNGKEKTYVLADITKDAKTWLFNFNLIKESDK